MPSCNRLQIAVDLTEAQVQDLLYLRRLFCGKIGQLGRARKDLMSKMPSESIGICHASDKLEEVTNLAEQLRANGSEEYRTYMQFASSFYRGVSFLCPCISGTCVVCRMLYDGVFSLVWVWLLGGMQIKCDSGVSVYLEQGSYMHSSRTTYCMLYLPDSLDVCCDDIRCIHGHSGLAETVCWTKLYASIAV